ncbi:MAG: HEPN domain-containing protein [Woeseiaceae bacterium]
MRKVRKQSDRLIKELLELRNSRKQSLDDFNFNFLLNFGDHCRLMHSNIGKDKNKEFYEVAYRQYFVFLVSSWETFFRDLFVYIYTRDIKSTEKLLEKMNIPSDYIVQNDVTLVELLSKSFNFQSIDDLESAYDSMWKENFLVSICETNLSTIGVNGKVSRDFCISSLFPDWHTVILKIFSIRHKIVHDSNYRIEPEPKFMQKAEVVFLLIPQLVTYLVAQRYQLKHTVMSDGKVSVPYIFSIDDVLSDPADWKVVK